MEHQGFSYCCEHGTESAVSQLLPSLFFLVTVVSAGPPERGTMPGSPSGRLQAALLGVTGPAASLPRMRPHRARGARARAGAKRCRAGPGLGTFLAVAVLARFLLWRRCSKSRASRGPELGTENAPALRHLSHVSDSAGGVGDGTEIAAHDAILAFNINRAQHFPCHTSGAVCHV